MVWVIGCPPFPGCWLVTTRMTLEPFLGSGIPTRLSPRCSAHMCSRLLLQLQSFKQTQDKPVETCDFKLFQGLIDFTSVLLGFFGGWKVIWSYIIPTKNDDYIWWLSQQQCWIDGKGLPSKRRRLVGVMFLATFDDVHPDESHDKWLKIRRYNTKMNKDRLLPKVGRQKNLIHFNLQSFLLVTWFLYLF